MPKGLEVADTELMSNQELKMFMMQMTETQRVWGCRYMETASPGLAPRRSRDWSLLFSEMGKVWFCVSLWSALWKERPE